MDPTISTTDKAPILLPELCPEAWKCYPGPILLLAGPGTGKTHQLALRVKDLVENHNVIPDSIMVITFTTEAAETMRRRISDEEKQDCYLEFQKRPSRIMTMHSLGNKIIRENNSTLGLPEHFGVLTDSRLRRVLFVDSALLCGFGQVEAVEAERVRVVFDKFLPNSPSGKIIAKYEEILRLNNTIDYDDQIGLSCKLLSENEHIRKKYASMAQHLLVDEYQDINAGQREMIDLLSKDHPEGVFAVGDDHQSIYSWRGGNPKYVREFHKEFGSNSRILGLAQSRRCCESILQTSLEIVMNYDPQGIPKPNPTFEDEKKGGLPVILHDLSTDDQESDILANLISEAIPKQRVLILVPARQYAEKIKYQLRRRHIAYDSPPNIDDAGLLLFEKAYEWLNNPDDDFALRICIDALCEAPSVDIPTKRARSPEKKKERFEKLELLAKLWDERLNRRCQSLWDAVVAISSDEGKFLNEIKETLLPLRTIEQKDLQGFLSYVASNMKPWPKIDDFIKEVLSWSNELRAHGPAPRTSVRIMTLQSAKGLEADFVCVVGLTEGILPRLKEGEERISEDARLVYVSTTRAIEELHLFHARNRDARISFLEEPYNLKPSRFISEISSDRIKRKYYQAPSKRRPKKIKKST